MADTTPTGPTREARCSCGQLTATTRGEPVRVSICHCRACQRRTGSTSGVQARFPAGQVTIIGEASRWSRTGDSGTTATFRFCPTCGATICWTSDAMPDSIAIPLGAFADPGFSPPTFSVYEDFRHPWTSVPEGAERLD